MIKKAKAGQKKIIIIGAGIAGLAACKKLIACGLDVMILEARDRAGGRIWIDHEMGIPFGRGAGWIHGDKNNPMTILSNECHATMVSVDPSKFTIFDRNGSPIPRENVQKFDTEFDFLLQKSKEIALHSKEDISLSTALSSLIKSEQFSPLERDLFTNKLLSFESYNGVSYEFFSARHWDHEETWPGDNCFLTSSYQPIIEGLQKNCPVQFNTLVTQINMREKEIEIVAENAVFYADVVLITLPLGVLKKKTILFNPLLPSDKEKAIQNLEMGVFNITALKFRTSFWPKEPHALFFTQFDALSIPVFFNLYHFIEEPIIVGFSGGERARQLENFSDDELIEKTMQNFKKVFGSQLPDPESYLNTRWSRDPFSYGSYTHIPVGASSDDYEALAKPVSDRLFFAGEATCSKYPATTHGAYLSGIREVERIKNILFHG